MNPDHILSQLNQEQKIAITQMNCPVLVLAGAGSGKTRVIVYRIAYLISIGVNPWEIMAVTFTNKAAEEMKGRIESILQGNCIGMKISTFHSFCAGFLRKEIGLLDYNNSFSIYDETDSLSLVKECLKSLDLDKRSIYSPERILDEISNAKNSICDFRNVNDEVGFEDENIQKLYFLYQKKLRENNALDFDDLLVKTLEIIYRFPEVLERNKYKFIHIDEYQDTNRLQYFLVKAFAGNGENLFVVGDEDQSIYGWRGADIRNILQFEKDFPNAKVISLEQNYRSTKPILNVANLLIRNNSIYRGKKLWTQREGGEKVKFYNAIDEHDEALFVGEEIEELVRNKGYNYSDCAVLFRTRAQSRVIEEAFLEKGIPYKLIGAVGFYHRREIKDIICYLRLISNPYDFFALKRIINQPRRGIGSKTIEHLEKIHSQRPFPIDEFEKVAKDLKLQNEKSFMLDKVIDFSLLIKQIREKYTEFDLGKLVDYVLKKSGYLKSLKSVKTEESEARIENLNEFKSKAIEFSRENGNNLEEFLSRLSLINDVDNLSSEKGFVNLLTLHCAKGLEFANIFIVGLEEGLLPHWNNIYKLETLEEERRLCYVGITRAIDNLFLTSAKRRLIFGKTVIPRFSRFLLEIMSSDIENLTNVPYFNTDGFNAQGLECKVRGKEGKVKRGGKEFQPGRESVDVDFREEYKNLAEKVKDCVCFNVGDMVLHKYWNEGQIVSIKDDELFVAFPSQGLKRFEKSNAQHYLNKIERK